MGTCPRLAERKRARQSLNGIILTLDLPDLLTADKRRREHLLQTLRSRLQDIRQHLHCQLPVYVVLTRLDLLQGFAALFQSLNRQDRDAILGVTFTRRAHENDDWRTELNAFWQTWVDRMNLALPDLMVAQTHTRASLFSFSRQMQGSREPLVSLLEGLLDGENMNVMLRGVYLTSSLQRGQMDDIFTQSAARQYRLGNNPLASRPLVDTAPYFTRSLFRRRYSQSLIWQRRAAPADAFPSPPDGFLCHWRRGGTAAHHRLASLLQW